jgi:hypothetical protein
MELNPNATFVRCDRSCGKKGAVNCSLPDDSVVDIETCQGWLQNSAYESYYLKVEEAWVKGKCGMAVARFKYSDRIG